MTKDEFAHNGCVSPEGCCRGPLRRNPKLGRLLLHPKSTPEAMSVNQHDEALAALQRDKCAMFVLKRAKTIGGLGAVASIFVQYSIPQVLCLPPTPACAAAPLWRAFPAHRPTAGRRRRLVTARAAMARLRR